MTDRDGPSDHALRRLSILDYDGAQYPFRKVLTEYLGLDGPPRASTTGTQAASPQRTPRPRQMSVLLLLRRS